MASVPPRPKLKVADSGQRADSPRPVAMQAERPTRVKTPTVSLPDGLVSDKPDRKPDRNSEKKRGFLAELFPSTKAKKPADLIHSEQTLERSRTLKSQANQNPTVTSPSKLRHSSESAPSGELRANPKKEESKNRTLLILLAALVFSAGILKVGFEAGRHAPVEGQTANSPAGVPERDYQNRVTFHRNETGRRLNTERMNVEYENIKSAPDISPAATKVAQPNMMAGLPLMGEKMAAPGARPTVPVDPDYADTRTEYSLQEQEAVNQLDAAQRSQYVDDFVANAAKAGLRVKVDASGHVTVIGRLPARAPGSTGGSANSTIDGLPH